MSENNDKYQGSCYCGQVKIEVTGQPAVAGYCHCHSCRKWHAAPINAWAIWPDAAVQITEGKQQIRAFDLQGEGGPSTRLSCSRCGGAVGNIKPKLSMTVVYAMTLADSGFKFEPTAHIFYAERAMDVHDNLPKFADVPTDFGGSGEMIEEPSVTGMVST